MDTPNRPRTITLPSYNLYPVTTGKGTEIMLDQVEGQYPPKGLLTIYPYTDNESVLAVPVGFFRELVGVK